MRPSLLWFTIHRMVSMASIFISSCMLVTNCSFTLSVLSNYGSPWLTRMSYTCPSEPYSWQPLCSSLPSLSSPPPDGYTPESLLRHGPCPLTCSIRRNFSFLLTSWSSACFQITLRVLLCSHVPPLENNAAPSNLTDTCFRRPRQAFSFWICHDPLDTLFLLRSHARAQSINLDSDNPAFCVLLWRLFPSSVVQCLVAQSLCHRCVGCPRSCSSGGGLNCFIAGTATTTDRGILCTSWCSCVGPPQVAYTTSITLCRPCVSHSFSTTQKLTTLSSHRECAIWIDAVTLPTSCSFVFSTPHGGLHDNSCLPARSTAHDLHMLLELSNTSDKPVFEKLSIRWTTLGPSIRWFWTESVAQVRKTSPRCFPSLAGLCQSTNCSPATSTLRKLWKCDVHESCDLRKVHCFPKTFWCLKKKSSLSKNVSGFNLFWLENNATGVPVPIESWDELDIKFSRAEW